MKRFGMLLPSAALAASSLLRPWAVLAVAHRRLRRRFWRRPHGRLRRGPLWRFLWPVHGHGGFNRGFGFNRGMFAGRSVAAAVANFPERVF